MVVLVQGSLFDLGIVLVQSLYLHCFLVYLGTALIYQIHNFAFWNISNCWLVDYAASTANTIVRIPCRHYILLVSWYFFSNEKSLLSEKEG